jgi:hypothetical protein
VIGEINYKSSDLADAGDWIELHNRGPLNTSVSGWTFSDSDNAHQYVIPANTVIPGGGYLVLFSDATKFTSRFPNVSNALGPFTFGLSSTGEALRLFDSTGRIYQSVVYDTASPWPQGAAGNGYTLELVNALYPLCDGSNWTIGCLEGSPGGPLTFPCSTTGVASFTDDDRIQVFPNPSSGQITIRAEEAGLGDPEIGLEFFNVLGEILLKTKDRLSGAQIQLELPDLPDGIYTAKITLGEKTYTRKIVIEHRGR